MGRRDLERVPTMPECDVTVTLQAPNGKTLSAAGRLQEFSPIDRLRRAAMSFGMALLAVAVFVFIPIIHLLAIPLLLIGGIVVAVRQLLSVARLHPLRIACPECGGRNRLGGGLGYRSITTPINRMCEECRRNLVVRISID